MFEPAGHRERNTTVAILAAGPIAVMVGFGLFVLTLPGPAFSGRPNTGIDLVLERLGYVLMAGGALAIVVSIVVAIVAAVRG